MRVLRVALTTKSGGPKTRSELHPRFNASEFARQPTLITTARVQVRRQPDKVKPAPTRNSEGSNGAWRTKTAAEMRIKEHRLTTEILEAEKLKIELAKLEVKED
jgi:hypothetical protein